MLPHGFRFHSESVFFDFDSEPPADAAALFRSFWPSVRPVRSATRLSAGGSGEDGASAQWKALAKKKFRSGDPFAMHGAGDFRVLALADFGGRTYSSSVDAVAPCDAEGRDDREREAGHEIVVRMRRALPTRFRPRRAFSAESAMRTKRVAGFGASIAHRPVRNREERAFRMRNRIRRMEKREVAP